MKTEPIEALRAMANDFKYNTGVVQSNIKLLIEESFISGVKYGQSSPKIRQLEWEEYENLRGRKSYFAKTTFSPYEVADGGDHYTMFSPDKRLRFASADAAKSAAQADFEKRVNECLE
jgi:hypothetical protein